MQSKKLHIISLGCSKNLVDSEVMLGRLNSYEIVDTADTADVIIVNTCGFIDAAKEESLQTVMGADSVRKDDSILVMAGCLSERYKEQLQDELSEVDIFTGVGDYAKIDELIAKRESSFSNSVYLIDQEERVVTGSSYHAYIKISEGCNQHCSFCAIPSFKGRLNSRALSSVVDEVRSLVQRGYYDFSFISQDSSSYLRDRGRSDGLIDLIDAIESIDGVKSARILYLYPTTTSIELLKRIALSKLFHNYFDMPIQHIDNKMLHIMKRGATKDKTVELLEFMRALPNSFVRTSFIVGHPQESDEAFEKMCEFASSFGFDRINVFAYSDEEGTSAYTMSEKISDEVANKRVELLAEIAKESMDLSLQKSLNREIEIVIDSVSSEHEYLLSARDLRCAPEIDGEILVNENDLDEEIEFGSIYSAKVTEKAGDLLVATVTGSR